MALAFVRLRPGIVGETKRTTHLVEVVAETGELTFLPGFGYPTLCTLYLQPNSFDILGEMQGMPCDRCLLKSPSPEPAPALVLDEAS
ncbi:hypothetical protein ACIA2T_19640 [Amycolatopsis japonica]|uniref:hypothetical protein n=1 Tax=Amycolatopsis japonica TaxID=208439 RepID=UPI0037BE13BC